MSFEGKIGGMNTELAAHSVEIVPAKIAELNEYYKEKLGDDAVVEVRIYGNLKDPNSNDERVTELFNILSQTVEDVNNMVPGGALKEECSKIIDRIDSALDSLGDNTVTLRKEAEDIKTTLVQVSLNESKIAKLSK